MRGSGKDEVHMLRRRRVARKHARSASIQCSAARVQVVQDAQHRRHLPSQGNMYAASRYQFYQCRSATCLLGLMPTIAWTAGQLLRHFNVLPINAALDSRSLVSTYCDRLHAYMQYSCHQ